MSDPDAFYHLRATMSRGDPGFPRQIQTSQEELGYLMGSSGQRVNHALQALDRLQLIRVGYAGIEIRALDGLRTFGSSRAGA